ncbi:hypothetical protein [Rhizobium sp. RAF56]|uniref:hypothetical protein n=1 Tax=Rhizobium sp. RAF56 TaxID=3233062 RepID=UPI003F955C31
MPLSFAAATGTTLTREKTAELYISIFVNADASGASALNEAHRAYHGEDELNVDAVPTLNETAAQAYAIYLLKAVPPARQEDMKAPFEKFSKAVFDDLQRTQCRATGSSQALNEYVKGSLVASVDYECSVVDVSKRLAALKEKYGKTPEEAMTSPALVTEMAEAFADETATRPFRGKIRLHSRAGSECWLTSSPDEARSDVLGALLEPVDGILH